MIAGSDGGGSSGALKRTALVEEHEKAGGRLVEFAGWLMPVSFRGIVEEHHAVRRAAGLFDVSHMGEIEATGPAAERFLNAVTTNDVSKLKPGRAHYTLLPNEKGGVRDDGIIYRLEAERLLMVVNASNHDKIWNHLQTERKRLGSPVTLEDRSAATTLLALQGPRAAELLATLTDIDLAAMRPFAIATGTVAGKRAMVARTGYTGEDGFEIFLDWGEGPAVWRRILSEGEELGVQPVGLGARDTLRLEARLSLYGHELEEDISPLEAGLGRWVKLDKGEFLGGDALRREKEKGSRRKVIGIVTDRRSIPRAGAAVHIEGKGAGTVTSGTFSPTLERGIALALVNTPAPEAGAEVEVELRGRRCAGEVVKGPFYQRPE